MAAAIRVPFRSYEEIRAVSSSLLEKFDCDKTIPVDVESIIELNMGIGIIPTPGFQQNHSVEGSLSLDLKTIYVDDYVYRWVENRYRFTLAHELGHITLHREIFRGLNVDSIIDWKRSYRMIDENVYYALERQAYDFAGLLLVPGDHLKVRFGKLVSDNKPNFDKAAGQRLSRESALFYFKSQAVGKLAKAFRVSTDVMERRIDSDGLISMIP